MKTEFNLNGSVNLDDYIRFCKSYQKYSFIGKYNLYIFIAIFAVFTYMYLPNIETMAVMFREAPFELAKKIMILVCAVIFVILFNTRGMRTLYKKQYEVNKELQESQNIKVGKEWIVITTKLGKTDFLKKYINRIIYDKDVIYIYQEKHKGYILKKQFLENENDFDDLKNFIKLNYENQGG